MTSSQPCASLSSNLKRCVLLWHLCAPFARVHLHSSRYRAYGKQTWIQRSSEFPYVQITGAAALSSPIICTKSHRAHRWAATVAYTLEGRTHTAQHLAMPFGARSSVEAWERVAGIILVAAREILFLPAFAYVDDFFCPERCGWLLLMA